MVEFVRLAVHVARARCAISRAAATETRAMTAAPHTDTVNRPSPVIAVFNSSSDMVTLLRSALDLAGFQTVVGHIPDIKQGGLDFIDFVERFAPAVIVYDVSPPYEANWNFLRLIRSSEVVHGCPFIVTTTNRR